MRLILVVSVKANVGVERKARHLLSEQFREKGELLLKLFPTLSVPFLSPL